MIRTAYKVHFVEAALIPLCSAKSQCFSWLSEIPQGQTSLQSVCVASRATSRNSHLLPDTSWPLLLSVYSMSARAVSSPSNTNLWSSKSSNVCFVRMHCIIREGVFLALICRNYFNCYLFFYPGLLHIYSF